MRRLLVLLPVLAACTTHAEVEVVIEEAAPEPASESAEPVVRAAESAPGLDSRNAYALAADIADALAEPSLTRAQSLEAVRTDWQGKRYRWDVAVSEALCTNESACNVLPFDYASQQARIVQGWLPRLTLTEETHADLMARCGAGLCVATVEATLSSFVLSPDDPTSLTLSDTSILGVRARREDESWVRRKTDPRLAKLRTGK